MKRLTVISTAFVLAMLQMVSPAAVYAAEAASASKVTQQTNDWANIIDDEVYGLGMGNGNARWQEKNHNWFMEQIGAYLGIGMDSNKVYLMKLASSVADEDCKCKEATSNGINYHINGALHGFGNYFANVEALSRYALYIRQEGEEPEDAEKKTLAYIENMDGLSTKSKLELTKSIPSITTMLNKYKSQLSTKTEQKYFVYGFILHSLQDTYSHRTLVPKYALPKINGTTAEPQTRYASNNRTDYKSRIGTADFPSNCWGNILKDYTEERLTFSVLHDYMSEPDNKIYTDNGQFCKERYQAAWLASCALMDDLVKNNMPERLEVVVTDHPNVKLVYCSDYIKQMD